MHIDPHGIQTINFHLIYRILIYSIYIYFYTFIEENCSFCYFLYPVTYNKSKIIESKAMTSKNIALL